jgi:hypothetical protein
MVTNVNKKIKLHDIFFQTYVLMVNMKYIVLVHLQLHLIVSSDAGGGKINFNKI